MTEAFNAFAKVTKEEADELRKKNALELENILKRNKVLEEEKDVQVPPEEREYLVLITYDEEGLTDWELLIGRQTTYDFIKELIIRISEEDDLALDMYNTFVIVEGISITDRVTVIDFMRYMRDTHIIDREFDIDEYIAE